MSLDALSPFRRGANAPLAGRTILQIVPPLAAGGDERATLAVTAALAETGARALVATDSGGLAGELQAIGGLFVRFPAATKNPLAMALNMRRLQHIIASERVDLVHVRSRWAAWTAVKACRKAKRPLVTSLPGDGVRTRPRTSFETAVAEGDIVIASSEFVAGRAESLFPTPPKRLRIVRPGMDLSKLQPERVSGRRVSDVRSSWGVAAHERIVLMPARLAPGRGQQTLIEAAALIKGQGLDDVRFVLAGEAAKPVFARELDALALKCGVQSMLIRVAAVGRSASGVRRRGSRGLSRHGSRRRDAHFDRGGRDGGAHHHLRRRVGSRNRRRAAARGRRGAHRMARSAPRAGRARRGDPRCAFARRLGARGRAAPVAGEDRRSLFA